MEKFSDIKPYLLPISLIILAAIFINIAVIGFVVQIIKKNFEGDYIDKGARHD